MTGRPFSSAALHPKSPVSNEVVQFTSAEIEVIKELRLRIGQLTRELFLCSHPRSVFNADLSVVNRELVRKFTIVEELGRCFEGVCWGDAAVEPLVNYCLIFSARLCLCDQNPALRTATICLLRWCMVSERVLYLYEYMGIDALVAASLDRVPAAQWADRGSGTPPDLDADVNNADVFELKERATALEFVRRWIQILMSHAAHVAVPIACVRTLIGVSHKLRRRIPGAFQAKSAEGCVICLSHDPLLPDCLAVVAELAVESSPSFFRLLHAHGATAALVDYLMDQRARDRDLCFYRRIFRLWTFILADDTKRVVLGNVRFVKTFIKQGLQCALFSDQADVWHRVRFTWQIDVGQVCAKAVQSLVGIVPGASVSNTPGGAQPDEVPEKLSWPVISEALLTLMRTVAGLFALAGHQAGLASLVDLLAHNIDIPPRLKLVNFFSRLIQSTAPIIEHLLYDQSSYRKLIAYARPVEETYRESATKQLHAQEARCKRPAKHRFMDGTGTLPQNSRNHKAVAKARTTMEYGRRMSQWLKDVAMRSPDGGKVFDERFLKGDKHFDERKAMETELYGTLQIDDCPSAELMGDSGDVSLSGGAAWSDEDSDDDASFSATLPQDSRVAYRACESQGGVQAVRISTRKRPNPHFVSVSSYSSYSWMRMRDTWGAVVLRLLLRAGLHTALASVISSDTDEALGRTKWNDGDELLKRSVETLHMFLGACAILLGPNAVDLIIHSGAGMAVDTQGNIVFPLEKISTANKKLAQRGRQESSSTCAGSHSPESGASENMEPDKPGITLENYHVKKHDVNAPYTNEPALEGLDKLSRQIHEERSYDDSNADMGAQSLGYDEYSHRSFCNSTGYLRTLHAVTAMKYTTSLIPRPPLKQYFFTALEPFDQTQVFTAAQAAMERARRMVYLLGSLADRRRASSITEEYSAESALDKSNDDLFTIKCECRHQSSDYSNKTCVVCGTIFMEHYISYAWYLCGAAAHQEILEIAATAKFACPIWKEIFSGQDPAVQIFDELICLTGMFGPESSNESLTILDPVAWNWNVICRFLRGPARTVVTLFACSGLALPFLRRLSRYFSPLAWGEYRNEHLTPSQLHIGSAAIHLAVTLITLHELSGDEFNTELHGIRLCHWTRRNAHCECLCDCNCFKCKSFSAPLPPVRPSDKLRRRKLTKESFSDRACRCTCNFGSYAGLPREEWTESSRSGRLHQVDPEVITTIDGVPLARAETSVTDAACCFLDDVADVLFASVKQSLKDMRQAMYEWATLYSTSTRGPSTIFSNEKLFAASPMTPEEQEIFQNDDSATFCVDVAPLEWAVLQGSLPNTDYTCRWPRLPCYPFQSPGVIRTLNGHAILPQPIFAESLENAILYAPIIGLLTSSATGVRWLIRSGVLHALYEGAMKQAPTGVLGPFLKQFNFNTFAACRVVIEAALLYGAPELQIVLLRHIILLVGGEELPMPGDANEEERKGHCTTQIDPRLDVPGLFTGTGSLESLPLADIAAVAIEPTWKWLIRTLRIMIARVKLYPSAPYVDASLKKCPAAGADVYPHIGDVACELVCAMCRRGRHPVALELLHLLPSKDTRRIRFVGLSKRDQLHPYRVAFGGLPINGCVHIGGHASDLCDIPDVLKVQLLRTKQGAAHLIRTGWLTSRLLAYERLFHFAPPVTTKCCFSRPAQSDLEKAECIAGDPNDALNQRALFASLLSGVWSCAFWDSRRLDGDALEPEGWREQSLVVPDPYSTSGRFLGANFRCFFPDDSDHVLDGFLSQAAPRGYATGEKYFQPSQSSAAPLSYMPLFLMLRTSGKSLQVHTSPGIITSRCHRMVYAGAYSWGSSVVNSSRQGSGKLSEKAEVARKLQEELMTDPPLFIDGSATGGPGHEADQVLRSNQFYSSRPEPQPASQCAAKAMTYMDCSLQNNTLTVMALLALPISVFMVEPRSCVFSVSIKVGVCYAAQSGSLTHDPDNISWHGMRLEWPTDSWWYTVVDANCFTKKEGVSCFTLKSGSSRWTFAIRGPKSPHHKGNPLEDVTLTRVEVELEQVRQYKPDTLRDIVIDKRPSDGDEEASVYHSTLRPPPPTDCPTTLLTYTAMTSRGLEALLRSGILQKIKETLLCKDQYASFHLESLIWSLGHIGSSEAGAQLLRATGLLSIVVDAAIHDPRTSLKSAAFYALGLLPNTALTRYTLRSYGWNVSIRGPSDTDFDDFLTLEGTHNTKNVAPEQQPLFDFCDLNLELSNRDLTLEPARPGYSGSSAKVTNCCEALASPDYTSTMSPKNCSDENKGESHRKSETKKSSGDIAGYDMTSMVQRSPLSQPDLTHFTIDMAKLRVFRALRKSGYDITSIFAIDPSLARLEEKYGSVYIPIVDENLEVCSKRSCRRSSTVSGSTDTAAPAGLISRLLSFSENAQSESTFFQENGLLCAPLDDQEIFAEIMLPPPLIGFIRRRVATPTLAKNGRGYHLPPLPLRRPALTIVKYCHSFDPDRPFRYDLKKYMPHLFAGDIGDSVQSRPINATTATHFISRPPQPRYSSNQQSWAAGAARANPIDARGGLVPLVEEADEELTENEDGPDATTANTAPGSARKPSEKRRSIASGGSKDDDLMEPPEHIKALLKFLCIIERSPIALKPEKVPTYKLFGPAHMAALNEIARAVDELSDRDMGLYSSFVRTTAILYSLFSSSFRTPGAWMYYDTLKAWMRFRLSIYEEEVFVDSPSSTDGHTGWNTNPSVMESAEFVPNACI